MDALELLHALVPALAELRGRGPSDESLEPIELELVELMAAPPKGLKLLLEWGVQSVDPPFGVRWAGPGYVVAGTCTWARDAGGAWTWAGTATVENAEAAGIAPIPSLEKGPDFLDLGEWFRARLPTVELAPGPRRDVRLAGRVLSDGAVLLEVVDREEVRCWLLTGRPLEDRAPAHLGAAHPVAAGWPDPTWPMVVLEAARAGAAHRRTVACALVAEGFLDLTLEPEDRSDVASVVIWPRRPGAVALRRGRFSWAYDERDHERLFPALGPAVHALLDRADEALSAGGAPVAHTETETPTRSLITSECDEARWPAASWPRIVARAVLAQQPALAAHEQALSAVDIAPSHLTLAFRSTADGTRLEVVVWPLGGETRCLKTERLAWAYPSEGEERFGRDLAAPLRLAMRAAEASLPAAAERA